ncbi:acetyl-CoA carboxylase biotin carboxyl carrier protein [Oscillatoria sp. CS-180]|uniref:acetyl-CoA carboxylase biotin carboxyl carrier protein n=1 Tax=Oscillatoria sp. CS-180 TaxID=3021720 RepID=UPI00232C928C|nr:acetyl-CoA carboxylase biotin carboxyl carrier protein [Oscillatoria sp. CS-180]MDB9527089.1 acetyl-CoA carboxylase biotin carboxyl carrier protein [Oscillatoria sp. CS-180]
MELNFNELRELVTTLSQTDISELTLKSGDFELTLRKQGALVVSSPSADTVSVTPVPVSAQSGEIPQPIVVSPPAAPPTPPPSVDSNLVEITSPMVGTFYRAPAPEEPPFVDVGDRIQSGQTVCIIEAMKLMNELEAEVTGEIVEILVENSQPVEFGQPLMRVKPN